MMLLLTLIATMSRYTVEVACKCCFQLQSGHQQLLVTLCRCMMLAASSAMTMAVWPGSTWRKMRCKCLFHTRCTLACSAALRLLCPLMQQKHCSTMQPFCAAYCCHCCSAQCPPALQCPLKHLLPWMCLLPVRFSGIPALHQNTYFRIVVWQTVCIAQPASQSLKLS